MKTILLGLVALSLVAGLALIQVHHSSVSALPPVNSVVGDASFRAAFGRAPDATTDEDLRIRTHLAYVLRELRAVPAARVPAALREARARNLDRLARYVAGGVFPRNPSSLRTRTPNFLDAEGRICAVGYLVREDLGSAAVAAINRKNQFRRIRDMEAAELAAWQATSGLTMLELASIQPTYRRDDGPAFTSKMAGVAEAGLGAGNLALTVCNGLELRRRQKSTLLGLGGVGVGVLGLLISGDEEAHVPEVDAALGAVAILVGGYQALRPHDESAARATAAAAAEPRVRIGPVLRDGGRRALAVQLRF